MNKFAKKISANLKQFKVEPDSAWLAQTRRELARYMNTAKIKPKRAQKFNSYSEVFKLIMQPMPVALASFGLTLIIGSAAVSHSQTTLPGDALYPVKRASEQIVLSLTSNPHLQSGFKNTFESRRLAELSQLSKKPEPATLNDYKTNSVFIVSHINNEFLKQKLASLGPVQPNKSNQVTIAKNDNDLKINQPGSKRDLLAIKSPLLTPAPVIKNTDTPPGSDINEPMKNFNNNPVVIDSPETSKSQLEMPVNEELNNSESTTTEEQPRYAYLGSGGGSASVKTPASQPTTLEPNKNEMISETGTTDAIMDNIESQPIENNIGLDNIMAVPATESIILADENANSNPDEATATPTTTEKLIETVEADETNTNPDEDQVDNNDENNDPAQDQPIEDPPPNDSSDNPSGDEEAANPDDSTETDGGDGKIISIQSNYP